MIGIIANPSSGKDIRRLVTHASSFDNNEKINIVRRVVLAASALGINRFQYLPDLYGIVPRAVAQTDFADRCQPLAMQVHGDAADSLEAARQLRSLGASCLVVLGGDGTNRVVSLASGSVPLVSISTGTNNVFPQLMEGTIAGLAAALVARGEAEAAIHQSPRLNLFVNGLSRDSALIDIVTTSHFALGARALWDMTQLREIVLSRVSTSVIGICALGGSLYPQATGTESGVYVQLGQPAQRRVLAAMGPGLVVPVDVRKSALLKSGQRIELVAGGTTVALDGEREIELKGDEHLAVEFMLDGPMKVDVPIAIEIGVRSGAFELSHRD